MDYVIMEWRHYRTTHVYTRIKQEASNDAMFLTRVRSMIFSANVPNKLNKKIINYESIFIAVSQALGRQHSGLQSSQEDPSSRAVDSTRPSITGGSYGPVVLSLARPCVKPHDQHLRQCPPFTGGDKHSRCTDRTCDGRDSGQMPFSSLGVN